MNPLARLGVIAGALTLAAGLTAPAHAARYAYDDATGDVSAETCTFELDGEEPAEECTEGTDPQAANGDITRVVIRHAPRKVVIRTHYRELTRAGSLWVGGIRTNEGVRREVIWDGDSGRMLVFARDGRRVRCGAERTVDAAAEVIEIRVPRSCLSRPRWVEVGVGHVHFDITDDETGFMVGADDGQSPVVRDSLTWSPRVRRG